MNKKEFFEKLKRPKGRLLFFIWLFTLTAIGGTVGILFVDYAGTPLEIFAYALFGLAACLLSYAVYTVAIYFPSLKSTAKALLNRWEFTARLLKNYGFRTIVFAGFSLAVSLGYAAYNVVISLIFQTIWYGALATYYVLLVCLRVGIVFYHGKRKGRDRDELLEVRKYRNCGILLIATILALSFAIMKMVSENAFFEHAGWTIYAAAAYSFYKICSGVYNFFKANRQKDFTVRALRNVNLADGAVSLLALQTSLLHVFGSGSTFSSVANALTGSAVCVLIVALGVFMLITANKRLKNQTPKTEEKKES